MSKLNWSNLKENLCPKCGEFLNLSDDSYVKCPTESENDSEYAVCFIMKKTEYHKLRAKISDKQALKSFNHDNTEALNNL